MAYYYYYYYLEEEEVAADVGAAVHGERLPVHLARRQRLQVDVVGGLRRKEGMCATVLSHCSGRQK